MSRENLSYDNIVEVLSKDKEAQEELAKLKDKFFSTTGE